MRLLLISFLFTASAMSQISDLDYCGMSKSTREFRCFSSIVSCRGFNIHGTCRPHRNLENEKPYWCLYQGKHVLIGCYLGKDRCEQRKGYSSSYSCFKVK